MPKPRFFEAVLVTCLILLSFIMFVVLLSGPTEEIGGNGWNISSRGPISDILVNEDGTLYVISGSYDNNISAIGPDGSLKWELQLPDNWGKANNFFLGDYNLIEYTDYNTIFGITQTYTVDKGQLYLYVGEISSKNKTLTIHNNRQGFDQADFRKEVVAISPQGRILWKTTLTGIAREPTPASIYIKNGTIYVYDNTRVTALDGDGRFLYTVDNVTCSISVDSRNNLYIVEASEGYYREGKTLKSYDPQGSLRWTREFDDLIPGIGWNESIEFNKILFVHDHTLYVPTTTGIHILDTNGTTLQVKDYTGRNYAVYKPMPLDSQGNLYLVLNTYPPFIDVLSPDGTDHLRQKSEYDTSFMSTIDGVRYDVIYSTDGLDPEHVGMWNLTSATLIASDTTRDKVLWNYTLPLDYTELYMDVEASCNLVPDVPYSAGIGSYIGKIGAVSTNRYNDGRLDWWSRYVTSGPTSNWGIRLVDGKDTVYVYYYTVNLDQQFTKYRYYVYSADIYALSKNGTLLWKKPVSSAVTTMAVNNSTLYYGTMDGKLFAENTGLLTGGIAIAAMLYLFIRFFLAGAVARAKTRLNKNENRNSIVEYVEANPGSTLRDISRGLDMNIGTIRYHMLVLELNHRTSALQADDKHVRYFPASGQYSREDRLVMSLAKREGMKKVLALLLEKEGLSNSDLSRELNMKESAVSRYMKVLTDRGVVDRREASGGSLAYSINSKLTESVGRAVKQEKS